MQSHPATTPDHSDRPPSRPVHPDSGWTFSPLTGLVFGLLLVIVVGSATLYLTWDHLPARIRFIPRYLETTFLPARPHPDFVPTPVGVAPPEAALASLELAAPVPTQRPAASEAEAPIVPVAETGSEGEAAPVAEVAPPAPTPAPSYALPGPSVQLTGIRHEYQGWNNCGPATLGMQLSFFGRSETQQQTAPVLKPNEDDKNVSPHEMLAYAQSLGFGGQVVVGADLTLLRTLLSNNFPVIVESWYIPEPDDEMGHYLLLTGYEGETLTFYDSYHGPNVTEPAAEFDALWKVFNRTAIVVWPSEQTELATAILGSRTDPKTMYEQALATAHAEVNANPQDKFAWFNLGSNLTALGDITNATKAFDTARSLQLPWRMLWYQFTPYEAYFTNGEYQEVIGLTTTTLESAGNLEESYYWRARAQAALGQTDAARRDLQQALKLNPNFAPAQDALRALP